MRKRIASFLICTLLVSACATAPGAQQKRAVPGKPANIKEYVALQSRAKKQAVVGFLIGAALGAASARGGDVWKSALVGGVAGALVGFTIGSHQDRLYASRDLAVRQAAYDPSQGYVARVEEVAFYPPRPKPGAAAKLYVRYVVLGPRANESIRIRMFRGLKYGEDYVFGAGPNEFVVPQGGGIVESTLDVTLPAKAPQGTYSVEALIEDAQGRFPQAVGTGPLYIVAQGALRRSVAAAR